MAMHAAGVMLGVGGLLGGLGGCASVKETSRTVEVGAGDYASAFDATREVLRSYRFTLERVDARSGVITTEARFSSGLATFWDPVQSDAGQEVMETLNYEGRRARVLFSRPGGGDVVGAGVGEGTPEALRDQGVMADGSVRPTLDEDLRGEAGPLVMKIDVIVERVQRPGRRLETSSLSRSTFTMDPALGERGMSPTYSVARTRDDKLAARLAAEVRARMAESGAR
ncbi:hypothetical protein [Nodularia spumigena]|uniref:hypothetical protein n=1 Tax=Nodularia spumigena TaxID=70799 RepID=UPI002B1FCF71|nr:hypothetical protein [Nodularia spumigena]MEA5557629.1 hypothetical protein [Nodularia spumigena CH309]